MGLPARSATAAIALSAAGLIACGSDEPAASKQAFARDADRICRESQREFDEIQRKPARSAAAAEDQAEALIEISSEALDQLRGLEPPPELEPTFERYLEARERALGYLEDGRDAAANNDPEAYLEAKQKAASEQGDRLQLAQSLGMRDCSRPSISVEADSD